MRGPEIREMGLDSLRLDAALQPRAFLDQGVVAEYAEAMEAGDVFPPVMVIYDGAVFWLADGWHRVEAARSVRGKATIGAEVREGTRKDALLCSLGANAAHGLRRTNADKRKAVERVLGDAEWAKWSDREIARVCRVGHPFVARVRKEVTGIDSSERTYTTKHGTVATMDTAPIAAANEARAAESVRTEAAPSDSKDGGVDGWTPEYGLDPELYAPIWRLEQAVEQYLDVRDGIRGGADANTEMRLDTLGKLRSAGFDTVYAEIKPHIDQRWRWCDLKQAINNVREQHRQEVEREQEAKPGNPWAPPLTPIAREEPVVQEEPQPEPASPREPSAWAPDLAPEKPEQEPFSDDVTLTVTISGAREPQKRKVSVSVTTYKHGRKLSEEYYGRPPAGMSELYAEINAVLVRVLDPEVLALAGSPPDHCGVEAAETVPQPPQLDSFPVGTWVRCGSRTGQVTEWIASGRVVVFRGEDGKTHRFPAFMVHAMYAEPA